jgi:hypothetical protein
MDYLCLALIWGDSPGLLQPQRNDMRTFLFKGVDTNVAAGSWLLFC